MDEHQGWLRTRCHLHREIKESDSVINGNNGYIENYVKCVALLLWFFKDNSVSWVNQDCLGLGGQRAFELLTSSEGCEQVYMLIRRLESGVVV
ncbi:MbcA/ParS/Xre antitoxin family protein [Pseudomonas juntendi]